MNKIVITTAFLIAPFFAMAQDTNVSSLDPINTLQKEEVVIKKIDPISINPLKQNKEINAKKSLDLINVRTYIKSLQMKRLETLLS